MKAALLCIILLLGGCATTPRDKAYTGIAADGALTLAAQGMQGLAEGGGGLITVPIRAGIVAYADTLPVEQGKPLIHLAAATSWGYAASNICVLLTLNPACYALGFAVVGTLWGHSDEERAFLTACAAHKRALPETALQRCIWRTA